MPKNSTSFRSRLRTSADVRQVELDRAEILPPDFLDSLQRVYGCDAVLFCELSTFRAYAPLAVGWRMKLVDVRTRQILWRRTMSLTLETVRL